MSVINYAKKVIDFKIVYYGPGLAGKTANLREYECTLDEIPYVLQYNKRDLPNVAPVEYLEYVLNRRAKRVPFFEATALEGKGVFDTLNTVSRMALASEFGGGREGRNEAS